MSSSLTSSAASSKWAGSGSSRKWLPLTAALGHHSSAVRRRLLLARGPADVQLAVGRLALPAAGAEALDRLSHGRGADRARRRPARRCPPTSPPRPRRGSAAAPRAASRSARSRPCSGVPRWIFSSPLQSSLITSIASSRRAWRSATPGQRSPRMCSLRFSPLPTPSEKRPGRSAAAVAAAWAMIAGWMRVVGQVTPVISSQPLGCLRDRAQHAPDERALSLLCRSRDGSGRRCRRTRSRPPPRGRHGRPALGAHAPRWRACSRSPPQISLTPEAISQSRFAGNSYIDPDAKSSAWCPLSEAEEPYAAAA